MVGKPLDCKHDQGLSAAQYCVVCGASAVWMMLNEGKL